MTTVEVNSDYLNILEPIKIDESIISEHYQDYSPQSQNNLDNGATIEISINASNAFILPCKSNLIIEGQLTKADNTVFDETDQIALINNAMM